MKILVALACLATMISAQRPFFASSASKGVPELASRFRTNAPNSSSGASTTTLATNIVNRVGADDATSTTPKLPVDARGDEELIKRISSWPRENQPFWYINADHIEKNLNPQGTNTKPKTGQDQQQNLKNRNNFEDTQGIVVSKEQFENDFMGKKPKYVEKTVYRYYF